MLDESEWKYPYPTQFLGGPEDVYTGVVDYDGETLRAAYRPIRRRSGGKTEDNVRFDFVGEGPLVLSVTEARLFLNNALAMIDRGEEKANSERDK